MRAAPIALLFLLAAPHTAQAATGLYTSLGIGYGAYSGSSLIITDTGIGDRPNTDPTVCCPSGGLLFDLRAGYSLFGVAAPEFYFAAHGWDLGSDTGGAGFIGGGLRLFPLGVLTLIDIDTTDFPIDVGIGGTFGYNLVGKDFAYTGSFFAFDLTVEYILSEVVSLGARIGYALPSFSNFVYTDYGADLGRCLDAGGSQNGDEPPFKKGNQVCTGRGPSSTFLAPQIVATFHFQLFD